MIRLYKIGGKVVDDPAALERFCAEFAALDGPKLLVHGGGVRASQVQKALGVEPVRIEGRRVTDAKTLEVVTMDNALKTLAFRSTGNVHERNLVVEEVLKGDDVT